MTNFNDLGLSPSLLKAIETEGYATPTPIQAQAIPTVIEGRDLLGIAQTGTGKTAAFALPILHRLLANKKPAERRHCRALILSPTRELANQIGESFRAYGKHTGLSISVVFGGVGHRPQASQLQRGVDILVATPGRLLDHMGERNISLESAEVFVLDEADQMLDLGFIVPIRKIVRDLPKVRQSLFFSATMPREIGQLASELLHNPARVEVTPVAKTADRVEQQILFIETPRKRALLASLFADPTLSRTLVFTRTKRGADRVARHLENCGVPVAAIHGNKSQSQRERALADFKAGKIRGLVATDIAARGIDVDQVSHVINYELPNIPESYVHRIGRTARAGSAGIAISLCDGEERAYLKDIERLIRQQIPSEDRRGDTALAEATASLPSEGRGGRERGERGGDRGRGRGGSGRRDQRGERREEHTARDRAADRGHERRDGAEHGQRDHRRLAGGERGTAANTHGHKPHHERRDHRDDTRRGEGHPSHRSTDARPDHRSRDARPERGEGRPSRGHGHDSERAATHGGERPHRGQRDHHRGERGEGRPHQRQGDGRPSHQQRRYGGDRPRHAHSGEGRTDRGEGNGDNGKSLSGVGFLASRPPRDGKRPHQNGAGKPHGHHGSKPQAGGDRRQHAAGGQHGLRRPQGGRPE